MRYLVTGGAGYIGSHFVWECCEAGDAVLVYDDMSRGHREMIHPKAEIAVGDIRDGALFEATAAAFAPDFVVHFAGLALVSESVANPALYDDVNVGGTRAMLDAMSRLKKVPGFIFSSSCAVFGTPKVLPISEDDPKAPESPYGATKLKCEELLRDYGRRYSMRIMALRYFNACGAHPNGKIGEAHDPETHLIPNLLKVARDGGTFTIFGNDFATTDGTCVRDYIHVMDLVEAHRLAATYLQRQSTGTFDAVHLGTGTGLSNLAVLLEAERVTGKTIPYRIGDRRPGDPAALYANPAKSREVLGFAPKYSAISEIIKTAWTFTSKT